MSTTTYAFFPPGGSDATAGVGTNLSYLCQLALASLCSDTTYAGLRYPTARGASGAWAVGAYSG